MKVPRILLVLLLCGGALPAVAGEMTAGVARVEITPPVGFPMGGYTARQGPSTGLHDPLFATVLLLKTGTLRVAIVSCDLRSFPSERVVSQARGRNLADHVLLAATHNHSGPMTWEDQTWPSRENSWFAQTEEKILQAIVEAATKMFPARLSAGSGELYLGHNRRLVDASGKVTMFWRNAEKRPTSPIDPTVGVIRVDDETGKPRAILVNYACHAVVLGPDNRRISADYPGALRRYVEVEMPGALCLFIQGGAGDINPYLDKQPIEQNGFAEVEKMGRALGEETLKVARRLKPRPPSDEPIRVAGEVIAFRDRWDANQTLRAGLTTLLLNREIAIATMPGEPFVDFQIALRDKSEAAHTFLFGYTYSAGGDWIGYIPTIRAAFEGGYGADSNTRLEVGAGETMVDRAIVHFYRLMGKLRDLPNQ